MMTDRPRSNLASLTQSEPHPGGLIRAVIETGRTRGSSATPPPPVEIVSPSPQKQIQSYPDKMDNRSFNGSTGARSDHNSQQVSPAHSARSARSGVSVRSQAHSHKSMSTQRSVQVQNQGQSQNSPRLSVFNSGSAQGGASQNQGQPQNSPRMSVGSNQDAGQAQGGSSQNQCQPQNSPRMPVGSNESTSQTQRGAVQDSSSGERQTSLQGNSSGSTQVQTATARGQLQENNQSQRRILPPGETSSQGQNIIHSREQRQGHQRQISSSRMNPAVPEFQSNFQRVQALQQVQTIPPLQSIQPVIFGPQVSQPVMEMMAKSEEKNKMVNDLAAKIREDGCLSSITKQEWIQDINDIGRKYDETVEHLKQEVHKNWYELHTTRAYLSNTSENLRQAYGERDRLGVERDSLEQKYRTLLRAKEKKSSENLNEIQRNWKELNQALLKQLKEKDAELERVRAQLDRAQMEIESYQEKDAKFVDAKQVQWMAAHPTSTVRSRQSSRAILDPFTSPSVASSSTFPLSGRGSYGSPATTPRLDGLIGGGFTSPSSGQYQPNNGPSCSNAEDLSRGLRRRPNLNLPTQRPTRGRTDVPKSPWETESSRAFNTEPGDTPIAASRSTALILSSTNPEDPSLFFQGEFAELYKLMEGWAMTYCNVPQLANDQAIARGDQTLWSFMMNCTYPGQRQDSHSHVMTLLNDPGSRPWFVMRMGVGYIVEEMLSLKSYKNFSPQVGAELSAVKTELQKRGLSNDTRQALIDRRAKAIQHAVCSPNWGEYCQEQINGHCQKLRNILGPMLNDGANRSKAGNDINAITRKAWNVSQEMNTAQVTFQVYFPETASKFTASTMIAKDKMDKNPMGLQINHTRLKLVITPVITMRDDRGTTIKAKNLHYATVLTMG
ncbi:hypothetical protein BKA64DRAFT_8932 [Cadophora sp. MPI-SDFR-AT-0126]|nr:hypothetical protein BKA64DRAFT_8932 [Leotiomycetes sp. MPI-SDFR-AT-0126]